MIGAERYFPNRFFAPRYWPKVGAAIVLGEPDQIWDAANRGLTWNATNRPKTWDAANRSATWLATDSE